MASSSPSQIRRGPGLRVGLLVLAILALLAALWAGLLRLGWALPTLQPHLLLAHGPLMVSGFLGTLIGVERAVALAPRRWPYVGPLLSATGALLLAAGVADPVGPLLITAGGAVLVAVFIVIVRQHAALYTATMAIGAAAWLVGSALWLFGQPFSTVALWWAGFLILTIVGERLELSRIRRLTRRDQTLFAVAVAILLIGLVVSVLDFDAGGFPAGGFPAGVRLAGVGMLGLALWLWRYDLARRTIRQTGLPRFIAACLLSGYVWLGIGGGLALLFGGARGGVYYDATLHSVFLGFVFAMIFGHAPIIFPAVLRRPITYHPRFYLPLVLLHGSLALRIGADLAGWLAGRQWGGMLNAIVLLLFLVNLASSLRGGSANPAPAER